MQQVFMGMHRIYCSASGMTIYVLVFNLEWLLNKHKCGSKCKRNCECTREHTIRFIKFWLNSIARNSCGAPVLLIGTHKDKVISPDESQKSNADLAKSNKYIAGAHKEVGDLVTDSRMYKLNKLRLHMPTQPQSSSLTTMPLVLLF